MAHQMTSQCENCSHVQMTMKANRKKPVRQNGAIVCKINAERIKIN